jgi:hypothetical protein
MNMNRRKLLGLAGGTAVSTLVMGSVTPPAQAFFPLWFRLLMGVAIRSRKKANKLQPQPRKRVKRGKRRRRSS